MTLTELERLAFANNDRAALALIYAGEEEFDTSISADHEAVIDDRNRLADALEDCVTLMEEAEDEAFNAAIARANKVLYRKEPQYEDTAADRLRKAQETIESLQAQLRDTQVLARRGGEALSTLQYLTEAYGHGRAAKPPKWAAFVLDSLSRIGAIQ